MANRRFTRAPVRRKTTWEGAQLDLNSTTGSGVFDTVIAENVFENHPNPTIVRMRGQLLLTVTAIGAGASISQIVMGIKLATTSAVAAGIGSIELPNDEIGSDWIWWDTRSLQTITAVPTNDSGEMAVTRVMIDSKAMRKVEVNKTLILVVQNATILSTQTVRLSGGIRVLLKQ